MGWLLLALLVAVLQLIGTNVDPSREPAAPSAVLATPELLPASLSYADAAISQSKVLRGAHVAGCKSKVPSSSSVSVLLASRSKGPILGPLSPSIETAHAHLDAAKYGREAARATTIPPPPAS